MAKKYVSQIDKQNEPYHIYRQGTSIGTNETGYTLFFNTPNREYNILDEEAYNYRPTGSSLNVGDSEKDTIVGGTLAWNQLANLTNGTSTINGVTFTKSTDGTVTVTGEATADATYTGVVTLTGMTTGRITLFYGCPQNGTPSTYYMWDAWKGVVDRGSGVIFSQGSTTLELRITVKSGYAISGSLIFKPQIFDLTTTLGTTIANHIYNLEQSTTGSGIAYFKKYFPKIYYQYSLPTLQNVCVGKHIMTEFNLWDEEWENGIYSVSTGNKTPYSGSSIRSKNYIRITQQSNYYIKYDTSWGTTNNIALFYDSRKKFLSYFGFSGHIITTPKNAMYMTFYMIGINSYTSGININISYPSLNGTYKPYKKHEYNINSNKVELRGIYKLNTNNNLYCYGDIWYGDSRIERKFGVVDLGMLIWEYITSGTVPYFSAEIPGLKNNTSSSTIGNIVCANYPTGVVDAVGQSEYNKIIVQSVANHRVYVQDTSYTDAATFKTAMSGVMLVYELATPYIEIQNRYENTQTCNNAGIEQYTDALVEDGTRDVEIPVGHLTTYDEPKEDLQKLS